MLTKHGLVCHIIVSLYNRTNHWFINVTFNCGGRGTSSEGLTATCDKMLASDRLIFSVSNALDCSIVNVVNK